MHETLREFLEHKLRTKSLDRDDWLERVRELFADVREWMSEYEQLQLDGWNVLVVDGQDKFNAPALTIQFTDAHVTIEPKGAKPWSLVAVCGTRSVALELDADGEWVFAWRDPTTSKFKPLTKESFADDLVKGLLS